MLDGLPEGELRERAIVIQYHQAQAFVEDAFAAGTTLYKDVGAPAPIDDVEGRIRQARQISKLRGGIAVTVVFVFLNAWNEFLFAVVLSGNTVRPD